MTLIERAARALAEAMGDDFDLAFASKAEWIDARGERGGRFRDVNEPRQSDYLEGARAVLEAIREPSSAMLEGFGIHKTWVRQNWQAMIDAALAE